MSSITPRRIEWHGPGGYAVVLDEDFGSLRPTSTPLDEGEIGALWDVIAEAKRCRDVGSAPIPKRIELPF